MTYFPQSERQRVRKELTDEVIRQVRAAVQEELEDVPKSPSTLDRDKIEEVIVDHTQHVVDALSLDELSSQGALLSHIANARIETNRLIRELRPPDGKSGGEVKQQ